ncbi:MAG: hypothetical protein JWN38_489 [Candidatus Saccharibacteria bacterium]|nr:hypothetical protein [Candidatus Saccharibacteria bacterium]
MSYEALADPHDTGVKIIDDFADAAEVASVLQETQDPAKVQWLDVHETYTNKRGLPIVQNHFAFALKLSRGDQSPLEALPATTGLYRRTETFVKNLASLFPPLASWEADELSFHLYDDQKVGLSRHRDNKRFIGLIAIVAIDGECDLVITRDGEDIALPVRPGALSLLRAPGLISSNEEIRPEHSVQNLRTDTRLSMMLRANDRPAETIPGFRYNNWRGES